MPSPNAADRREQLAAIAYELVADGGIDRLSLRTVARQLGATTGLVSHHFVDRRDLLAAALDHAARVMLDRVAALPAGSGPVDVLAAVLPTDDAALRVWRFSLSVRTAGLFDAELRPFDERIRAYWDADLPRRLRSVPRARRSEAASHLVALVDGIALQATLRPQDWPAARQLAHLQAGFDAVERGAPARGRTHHVAPARPSPTAAPDRSRR